MPPQASTSTSAKSFSNDSPTNTLLYTETSLLHELNSSLREDDGDDHTVETEGLTEDENKDHADEDGLLLSVGADTGITDDTNSETSSKGGETASQTRGEMLVSISIVVHG